MPSFMLKTFAEQTVPELHIWDLLDMSKLKLLERPCHPASLKILETCFIKHASFWKHAFAGSLDDTQATIWQNQLLEFYWCVIHNNPKYVPFWLLHFSLSIGDPESSMLNTVLQCSSWTSRKMIPQQCFTKRAILQECVSYIVLQMGSSVFS